MPITFTNKDSTQPTSDPRRILTDDDVNEIKSVVNSNETTLNGKVSANSPTLITPNLGIPSAVVLTNGTGLPISTGVSGLGSGVATFLGTPNSANLKTAVTDETGSGALVFATSPTLVTPALGTPSAVVLTNGTGLPIAGITGLGTSVPTALAGNIGTAGSMVLFNGAGGTPSSINLANATGLPSSALTTLFVDNETPSGTMNSINLTFTLANTPITGSVKLYWNGMRVNFSITGATITMNNAPDSGDDLKADYRK